MLITLSFIDEINCFWLSSFWWILSRTSDIISPILLKSFSLNPLEVAAAVPNLKPLVILGGLGSYGMAFLLQAIPTSSNIFSALSPVIFFGVRSSQTIWESVPPVTILNPLFTKDDDKPLALEITF